MNLITWFVRNPIAANVLMLIIVAGGILGFLQSKRYTIPPQPQNQLQITADYPGAGPGEVEHAVCIPIEEAIHELNGIKNINSVANQAQCEVTVEFDPAIGAGRFQAEVKAKIDTIKTLPKEVEKLLIQELKTGTPAVLVVVRGEVDLAVLQQQRDQLKALLNRHPDIGMLTAWPQYPREISIEITELEVRKYGLDFDELSRIINAASHNIPAGEIKKSDGKILLRSKHQALNAADFAAIELRAAHQGGRLLLGDIAHIRETVAEKDLIVRVDDIPAVQIVVMPKDQIKTTVDAVNAVIAEFRPQLPHGVDITTWDDWSKYYDQYMTMLTGDAISGFMLVFLVLMFTLRFHLAVWVSAGIVISLCGALWVMRLMGISLNTYSISALILILGVLADDAIVVGENIYTFQQRGHDGLASAIHGTLEVTPLVVMMVLSTMIAFIPGLFLPGLSGYLMYTVSIVIIITLAFSMIEALLILPSHLAVNFLPVRKSNACARIIGTVQDRVDAGMQRFVQRVYIPTLIKLLRVRYITLAAFLAALCIVISLVLSGRIPSVMDAEVNEYYLLAQIEHLPGTPFGVVDQHVRRLEEIARDMQAELDAELGFPATNQQSRSSFQHIISIVDENVGLVDIEIAIDERVRSRMDELKEMWQERFGDVPAGATLSFQTFWPRNLGMPATQAAKAIEFKLIASDPAIQGAAGEVLKARLSSFTGVHSVTGSMQIGKPEMHLKLKPEAATYGLSVHSLGEQVRNAFFGLEVQRFYQDRDEVRVLLRYPETQRRSMDNVQAMPIVLPDGAMAPFAAVAEVELTPGFASITRQNRERVQLISADVFKEKVNVETVLAEVRANVIPELEKQFPGLRIEPGQSRQKQEETRSVLWGYGALAIIGIYAMLAIPLRSYGQPLLIMLAIPFGFIGAVLGHLLLNIPLSLESYVALFAVGGIVVNDSLILVAKLNEELRSSERLYPAVISACKARFRAIFLTTATTFLGLLPLILEQSPHAEKILPMSITLGFGILFATFITLILVPVSCVVLKEAKSWYGQKQ